MNRLRDAAWRAAIVNGLLIVLVPATWLAYADYTSDAVRPVRPTLLSSASYAWPVVAGGLPVALLVGWRSLVHARGYLAKTRSGWGGVVESAAVAAAYALFTMVRMTAATWTRQSAPLVAAYIAVYVAGTAIVGVMVGLVLAATAHVALRLGRRAAVT
jgi:hypothetical protein